MLENELFNSNFFSAGKNSLGHRKWGCEVRIEIAQILRPGEFFKDYYFTPFNIFTFNLISQEPFKIFEKGKQFPNA